MGDASDRLIEARKAANYATATAAAEAMRIPEPTYLGHENGSRGFGRHAARYAEFFKVNLVWLLTGRGPMRGQRHRVVELFDAIPPEKQPEAIDYLEFLASRRG